LITLDFNLIIFKGGQFAHPYFINYKMKNFTFLIILLFSVFWGCSSTKETAKDDSNKNTQEIYVFDDVVNEDTLSTQKDSLNSENIISNEKFIVQVGAFSSMDKAEKFVKLNQSQIDWKMKITFSSSVNYYVVQLPAFSSRSEAEKVRDQLWKTKIFNDAFILTK